MYVNIEPTNQFISNSLYFQKLFEEHPIYGVDSNSPPNEYLTVIMNQELNALCPTGYKNCLLDGMEIVITGFEENLIHFKLFPGLMILNNIIFEHTDEYDFDLNLEAYTEIDFDYILLMFNAIGNTFHIKSFLIDSSGNIISSNINDYDIINDLPFRMIKVYKSVDLSSYTERNLNESFIYYPKFSVNFNSDENLQYSIRDLYHIQYSNNQRLVHLISPINRYSIPSKYLINGIEELIPRYNIIELKLQEKLIDWYNRYYFMSHYKDLAFNKPIFQNYQKWKYLK